jgi:DNA-binding transcriptional MerR regulator
MANFHTLPQTVRVVEIKREPTLADVVDVASAAPESSPTGLLWGVGAVSTQLDIARPTLRTWDRRYGLGPSLRTAGGHRRYTETDVARVQLMNKLLDSGVAAAQAAHIARTTDEASLADGTASAVSARPNLINRRRATSTVSALVRATLALDPDELSRGFSVQLQRRGVVEAWDHVIAPFLVEIGDLWAAGELGVECEHLASGALTAELRAFAVLYRNRRPAPARTLLACADEEQHALPVFALEAALAERKLTSVVLGQALPAEALARALTTRRPAAVFLWASLPQTAERQAPWLAGGHGPCRVVLAGPGWEGLELRGSAGIEIERGTDMADAVRRVERALNR